MRNKVILNVDKDIDIEIGSSLCSHMIDYSNDKIIRIAVKYLICGIMIWLETIMRSLQQYRYISIVGKN